MTNNTTSTQHRSARASARRGFTLVELMVAMTGGLMITVAVFAFTRDVTSFFQRQMRLSEATQSSVSGFERLRADIQRAGFLSSPNLARDPKRCPLSASGVAAQAPQQIPGQFNQAFISELQKMGMLRIEHDTYVTANYMLDNNGVGISPDRIVLYGNYTTAEQFPVHVAIPGTNYVTLEGSSMALARLGIPLPLSPGDVATNTAVLSSVFRPGRILRFVDATGREQYSVVADVDPTVDFTLSPKGYPSVFTDPLVGFIYKDSANGTTCGIKASGALGAVNPVDIIRYELIDISTDANFAALFDATLAPSPHDDQRLDLVRRSLLPDGTVEADTTELISEYAVDLKFGLTVNTNVNTGAHTYYGEDDPALMDYADIPFGTTSGQIGAYGPHMIRSVHARLAVRTREADSAGPILRGTALTDATSEQLYRVKLGENEFARIRSLRAHIATRNSRNETWN